jgi:hypothetical protein
VRVRAGDRGAGIFGLFGAIRGGRECTRQRGKQAEGGGMRSAVVGVAEAREACEMWCVWVRVGVCVR